MERDLKDIDHLKKDGNAANLKIIYDLYSSLNARQEAIKPILPLQIEEKAIHFKFNNYSDHIISSRNALVDYMYDKGLALLELENKRDLRQAYEIFSYIESIYPHYQNTNTLMQEAHDRGTDFIIVTIENQTRQIIPERLEADLLDFDTYGLDQFWMVYHSKEDVNIKYDYALKLQLKQIHISAEELHETAAT